MQSFWEQSETNRTSLSNADKLVYLQQAIRSGSTRSAIEELSHSGDQSPEAVSCLKSRYNRPHLIHQAHVRSIMDTPPLRDSSGNELRRIHDLLQQHLRALKTMKSEPDPSFVTSLVELKLDEMLFEWQKYNQDKAEGSASLPRHTAFHQPQSISLQVLSWSKQEAEYTLR